MVLLFSCANATCAIPEAHRELFRGSEDVVTSSEGWEPGSLNLAQAFAMKFRTPLVHGDVTRLLIDLDQEGEARWSRFSMKLPEATRLKLVDRHERPFRSALVQRIAEDSRRYASVFHLMIHTDPATTGRVVLESAPGDALAVRLSDSWCLGMKAAGLDAVHHRDSEPAPFAASLLADASAGQYAQIRMSVSQSFFLSGVPMRWETLKKQLMETLGAVVAAGA